MAFTFWLHLAVAGVTVLSVVDPEVSWQAGCAA